jgi:hypothetical protein
MKDPQKKKQQLELPNNPITPLLDMYLKKGKALPQRNICTRYGQDMGAISVLINRRMDKEIVAYVYTILLSLQKEGNPAIFYNMD